MNPANERSLDFAREIPFDQILTNPILDLAARVWEEERYEAFRICYRSMRRLDDLVDHRKESGVEITSHEVTQFSRMMRDWLVLIRERKQTDPFIAEMVITLDKFGIPLWPWERLIKAMGYDLTHNGFATFATFLRYTEGAAIAPASIFMHLIGADSLGERPPYNIRDGARALAIFSYLVHIVRDFQKDQKAKLHYFCDDLMVRAGTNREECAQVARDENPTPGFRRMMAEYYRLADFYRIKARHKIDTIMPMLAPRYQLSLELIYQLYYQIYCRIDPPNGFFTTAELNPTEAEVKECINLTIERFIPIATV